MSGAMFRILSGMAGTCLAWMLLCGPVAAHPHGPLDQAEIEEQAFWIVRRLVSLGQFDPSWYGAKLVYSRQLEAPEQGHWLIRFENSSASAAPVFCVTLDTLGAYVSSAPDCENN